MKQNRQTNFAILRQKTGYTIPELGKRIGFSERTLWRYESGDSQPKRLVFEAVENLVEKKTLPVTETKFTFIDLFAGIGGLRIPFEEIGGQCVFTSEWDRFAQQTYRANFPQDSHDIAGDITKIPEQKIFGHDLLLAGFPCQPFSIAGVSKKNALGKHHGFRCESQGTLFFDVARIIAHHRPKVFLLENVKNLLNHDKGRTFEVIQATLEDDLGYKIHTKVINAKGFVPQHRERVYIIGFRATNGFDFDSLPLPDPLKGPDLSVILHPEDGTEAPDKTYTYGPLARVSDKYYLTDHLWNYLKEYARKHREKGNGFGFGLCSPDDIARTLSARYYKDGSEILIKTTDGRNPRRLTPRECSRLMGFDKPGESSFSIPVSDTQAYKQFGNAVVVPVVRAIAQYLEPWIVQTTEEDTNTDQKLAFNG